MTVTFNGILDTIRASPDDDAPRLVCADWLEEHGNAIWAKLIRTQVHLTHPDRYGIHLSVLNEAMADQFRALGNPATFAAIPGLAGIESYMVSFDGDHIRPCVTVYEYEQSDPWGHVRFDRGFVAAVRGPLLDIRRILCDLLRHHPLTEAVPTDISGDDGAVGELPSDLERFIDRWVNAKTMTDSELTNLPAYWSKVLIAEAWERMARESQTGNTQLTWTVQ